MNTINDLENSNVKKTLGIRGKLFLGFALIIIILLMTLFINLIVISNTENFAERFVKVELPMHSLLIDLNSEVQLSQHYTQSWIVTNNNQYKNDLATVWNSIEKTQMGIALYSNQNQLTTGMQIINATLKELKLIQNKIVASNDKASATTIMINEELPIVTRLLEYLNSIDKGSNQNSGILDIQNLRLSHDAGSILNDMYYLKIFEYSIFLAALLLSLIIAYVTARKIIPPLHKAIFIAKKIAHGERNLKIATHSTDETGELLMALKLMQKEIKETEQKLLDSEAKTRKLFEGIVRSAKMFSSHSSRVAAGDLRHHLKLDAESDEIMIQLGNELNKMTENLASIAQQITQACQHMVVTVEEVHHAVDAQSAGASEQASSVNEISASLTEIEKSSAQTMAKAKSLGQSAERTREKGQQGLEAVGQSIEGMESIRKKVEVIAQTILDLSNQTQQVGEITAVVNNLAQQSKMLALNASIEAAKAGEAGKGFAVVAVEVRNLAEQSEQATTQVQKILEDIQHAAEKAVMVTEEGTKGVDAGTRLVEQTGDVIRNLNDVIHETTIASQQIESAVRQESAGIEQITAGMNEINQVTRSFVESVKQTTEAINNLSDIAKNLKSYVDTYKLG